MRRRLIETAARLLADEGPEALTTRRLAREVGSSTMTVYTQFGGMEQLRVEVRREAFARLASQLSSVSPSRDPVRDLAEQGYAYCLNAVANPHLYRAAFTEAPRSDEDARAGLEAFQPLLETVERCMAAGRFRVRDSLPTAAQIWAATHGAVSLHLAGVLSHEALMDTLGGLWESLGVAFGDERRRARRSISAARARQLSSSGL